MTQMPPATTAARCLDGIDLCELYGLGEPCGDVDDAIVEGLIAYCNMLESMLVISLQHTRRAQMMLATKTGEPQKPLSLEADITAIRNMARTNAKKVIDRDE